MSSTVHTLSAGLTECVYAMAMKKQVQHKVTFVTTYMQTLFRTLIYNNNYYYYYCNPLTANPMCSMPCSAPTTSTEEYPRHAPKKHNDSNNNITRHSHALTSTAENLRHATNKHDNSSNNNNTQHSQAISTLAVMPALFHGRPRLAPRSFRINRYICYSRRGSRPRR